MSIAHNIIEAQRTSDILISENVDFAGLLLSDYVIKGLKNAGFQKPSPIQLKAIPLGRCGLDLVVQAKSGTGKTCVFSVVALESILLNSPVVQVLVLAPTREIAIQVWDVIRNIGSAMPCLQCQTFIGGMPLSEDKKKTKYCHIAIGTPGRIKQLIEEGSLKTSSIRLFILDEADKLLEEGFQEQINWIYSALPENKQMLALSATYPEYLAQHLTRYMRNPTFIRLNVSDPALLGIKQYYKVVDFHSMVKQQFDNKVKAVVDLLSSISFQQCLVFSNLQTRAQNLSDELQSQGWPTACIAGFHQQKDRNEAMAKLKTYKCRVLISTDLSSRGIDADKVNLIINLDVPKDHETYLHRIGRAGRYGSFGAAVTIVSSGEEERNLNYLELKCNTHIFPLPDPVPVDLVTIELSCAAEVVSTEQIITRPSDSHRNHASHTEDTSDHEEPAADSSLNEPQQHISLDEEEDSLPNQSGSEVLIHLPSHESLSGGIEQDMSQLSAEKSFTAEVQPCEIEMNNSNDICPSPRVTSLCDVTSEMKIEDQERNPYRSFSPERIEIRNRETFCESNFPFDTTDKSKLETFHKPEMDISERFESNNKSTHSPVQDLESKSHISAQSGSLQETVTAYKNMIAISFESDFRHNNKTSHFSDAVDLSHNNKTNHIPSAIDSVDNNEASNISSAGNSVYNKTNHICSEINSSQNNRARSISSEINFSQNNTVIGANRQEDQNTEISELMVQVPSFAECIGYKGAQYNHTYTSAVDSLEKYKQEVDPTEKLCLMDIIKTKINSTMKLENKQTMSSLSEGLAKFHRDFKENSCTKYLAHGTSVTESSANTLIPVPILQDTTAECQTLSVNTTSKRVSSKTLSNTKSATRPKCHQGNIQASLEGSPRQTENTESQPVNSSVTHLKLMQTGDIEGSFESGEGYETDSSSSFSSLYEKDVYKNSYAAEAEIQAPQKRSSRYRQITGRIPDGEVSSLPHVDKPGPNASSDNGEVKESHSTFWSVGPYTDPKHPYHEDKINTVYPVERKTASARPITNKSEPSYTFGENRLPKSESDHQGDEDRSKTEVKFPYGENPIIETSSVPKVHFPYGENPVTDVQEDVGAHFPYGENPQLSSSEASHHAEDELFYYKSVPPFRDPSAEWINFPTDPVNPYQSWNPNMQFNLQPPNVPFYNPYPFGYPYYYPAPHCYPQHLFSLQTPYMCGQASPPYGYPQTPFAQRLQSLDEVHMKLIKKQKAYIKMMSKKQQH